jgi:Suppressor of fused protein (SUFU)
MSAPEKAPARILRHERRTGDSEIPGGSAEDYDAIAQHAETHWGKVETVFREFMSAYVHVDVLFVKVTKERPFHFLITSGMSDRPMPAPEGAEDYRYLEMVISLPPEWPLDDESFKDELNWWPVRWLKKLARFAHEYNAWAIWGHTIAKDEPPVRFAANTKFCSLQLCVPTLCDAGALLRINDPKSVRFYSLIPIYLGKMEFALKSGGKSLIEKLGDADVAELLNLKRKNVCA